MELQPEKELALRRERMKKEMRLQARLACRLFGIDDPEEALKRWTDNLHAAHSPAALFGSYATAHPDLNLDASDPKELDELLRLAGIAPTLH